MKTEGHLLELERILAPDPLIGLQSRDADKDPVPLLDLDLVLELAPRVEERLADGDHVVALGLAGGHCHRRVQTQSLADDLIQIGELVELFHRRRVGFHGEKLLAQLRLEVGVLRELTEEPTGCRGGGFVACGQERRDLW